MRDELDVLANGIEQGFMQPGGWKECRYLLGKLVEERDATIDRLQGRTLKLEETLRHIARCQFTTANLQKFIASVLAQT